MRLSIRHETAYHYSEPLNYSIQQLRLTPRMEASQRTISWEIDAAGSLYRFIDAFGNISHMLTLKEQRDELRIVAHGVVESFSTEQGRLPDHSLLSPLVFTTPTRLTQPNERIEALAHQLLQPPPSSSQLMELAGAIRDAVLYRSGITEVGSTAQEALEIGSGVCQDHVHLFIACCIALGIPARYVSGYVTDSGGGPTASHAWVDVWAEDPHYAGWVSIDVTNGRFCGEGHCRLAIGRDYEAASPIRGVRRGGGNETLGVEVSVLPSDQ